MWIVQQAAAQLDALPTLVEVEVPPEAKLHVVGDLHGQFPELLRVLELCGPPEPQRNSILFNGDFVDRGPRSVEVILSLLALMLAYPGCVFLNRGNHETPSMNRVYGFEDEVLRKYSQAAFDAFQRAFRCLPLATVINGCVLVLHGGLFSRDGVSLRDIAAVERRRSDFAGGLALEALWSDPSPEPGRGPSPRGAGVHFGPDVTKRFCEENGLQCCIRSHEVVQNGYEWQPGGRCVTVFSAANYVGQVGNLGAVCHITPRPGASRAVDLAFSTFAGAGAAGRPGRRSRL